MASGAVTAAAIIAMAPMARGRASPAPWSPTCRRSTSFLQVVREGRKSGGNSAMDGFGDNPNFAPYLVDIYAYLQARADGVLGRGRPARLRPLSGSSPCVHSQGRPHGGLGRGDERVGRVLQPERPPMEPVAGNTRHRLKVVVECCRISTATRRFVPTIAKRRNGDWHDDPSRPFPHGQSQVAFGGDDRCSCIRDSYSRHVRRCRYRHPGSIRCGNFLGSQILQFTRCGFRRSRLRRIDRFGLCTIPRESAGSCGHSQ